MISADSSSPPSTPTRTLSLNDAEPTTPTAMDRALKRAVLSPGLIFLLLAASTAQFIATSAVSMYSAIDLSFGTVQLTHFWMYMGWAAWASPLIGCISDNLIIFGEKRRPCIALGIVGNAVIWGVLWRVNAASENYWGFVGVCLLQTLLQMCISVPLNAMVVEIGSHLPSELSDEERTRIVSRLQSHAMIARSVGSLIGGVAQTVMLLYVSVRGLLGISVGLYASLAVPLLLVRQHNHGSSVVCDEGVFHHGTTSVLHKWRALALALHKSCAKGVRGDALQFLLVLIFVLAYCSMPDAGIVYFQYVALAFEFPPWFLSLNMSIGLLAGIIATALFGSWMQMSTSASRARRCTSGALGVFIFGCVCSALGYLTNVMLATGFSTETLRILPSVFVPLDNFCTSFMSRLAFMPVIQVAAERSPPGFEGFVYELFTVASLGGSSVSALITAEMARNLDLGDKHWGMLWALLVACAACKLLPIFLAVAIPKATSSGRQEAGAAAGAAFVDAAEVEDGSGGAVQVSERAPMLR